MHVWSGLVTTKMSILTSGEITGYLKSCHEYNLYPNVLSILTCKGRELDKADISQYRLLDRNNLYNIATAPH